MQLDNMPWAMHSANSERLKETLHPIHPIHRVLKPNSDQDFRSHVEMQLDTKSGGRIYMRTCLMLGSRSTIHTYISKFNMYIYIEHRKLAHAKYGYHIKTRLKLDCIVKSQKCSNGITKIFAAI